MMRRRLLLAVMLGSVLTRGAQAMPTAEQARIDRLIRYVESRLDVQFVRNGSPYSGQDAAKFLRGKLDSMGGHVNTAQQFIEQIATRSSTSGQPYLVRHADGRMERLANFLGDELRRIDAIR
jgi:hypothetical protein